MTQKRKIPNGILPNNSWLCQNGFGGLSQCMWKNPHDFKSIIQDNIRKRLAEYIELAEKLAEDNGGTLPSPSWLRKEDHHGLLASLRSNRDNFKHIKQKYINKNLEEAIESAEKLSKEHGGQLPSFSWLKKNGYLWIYKSTYKYPEEFKHIEKEYNGGKGLEEHICEAEKLAKENNGILPCSSWLMNNGHGGLRQMKRKHPKEFSHIKQERK